jgi:hypothetical protein
MGRAVAEDEKAAVRAAVFNHLSGIALAPTVKGLSDRRVFDLFANMDKRVALDEVVEHTGGNRGYLRVALRLLASAGWMSQHITDNGSRVSFNLTEKGSYALKVAPPLYAEVVSFIPKAVFLEDFLYSGSDDPVPRNTGGCSPARMDFQPVFVSKFAGIWKEC